MTIAEIRKFVPKDPVTGALWRSCLVWAAGEADIMESFYADTGFAWEPGTIAIDKLIDAGTGMRDAFCLTFIPWFHINIWEQVEAPVRERIAFFDAMSEEGPTN